MTPSSSKIIEESLKVFFAHEVISNTRDAKTFQSGDVVIDCHHGQVVLMWLGSRCQGAIFSHRVSPLLQLISQTVQEESLDLNCRLIIGPHDSIEKGDPPNRSVSKAGFCCLPSSPHLAIPDPHYLSYVSNPIVDRTPFGKKRNQVVFRGTDGNIDRIKVTARSCDNPFLDFKISRFLSHDAASLKELGIDISSVEGEWLAHQDQLEYRYILDMYGHSIGWDRPCWGLPSNSILILCPPEGERALTWYYPSILRSQLIPELTPTELLSRSDLSEYDSLLFAQQEFAQNLLNPQIVREFLKSFLLTYNSIYNS